MTKNELSKMIREVLKEEVSNQDAEYLLRILKSAGPKITKAINNLEKKIEKDYGGRDSSEYKRIYNISRGWDEVTFGYGELYYYLTRPKK